MFLQYRNLKPKLYITKSFLEYVKNLKLVTLSKESDIEIDMIILLF